MKRILAIVALVADALFGSACTHYIPANEIFPSSSQLAGVDIVMPNPDPGFSVSNREAVARLVSFLSEECRWTMTGKGAAIWKDAGATAYRIVIRRIDGTSLIIDVPVQAPGNMVIASGYIARLSGNASVKLDQLAGLERIRLHTF